MQQVVEIIIRKGMIQDVQLPRGVCVVIRDYDVEGTDPESGFDTRQDKEGAWYQHLEFREEEEETPEPETEHAPDSQQQ